MAKKTNTFLNDIKNYDLIREMLHHIYMYGNYSKVDIVKSNMIGSERTVYDMINRIKNYLDGEYLTTHKLPNRKQDKNGYRLKYDPFQCPINYLANTYRNCSYVVEDFIFYYTLLQAFKPYEKYNSYKHLNLEDYSEDVSELIYNNSYSYDDIMSNFHDVLMANEHILQTLDQSSSNANIDTEILITPAKARDRLNELVELGIITKENSMYSLAPDLLEDYEENLENLMLLTQFFYNFNELCIPGYYLATTLAQYSITVSDEQKHDLLTEQENPVFFYKNCSLQNVIDDNIFWSILTEINNLSPITYDYKNKNFNVFTYTVFPLKIIIEKQYGRQYLYAYNYSNEQYSTFRLDSISNISTNTNISNDEKYSFLKSNKNVQQQINAIYIEKMKYSWNTTVSDKIYDILIHFSCEKKGYVQLLNRVKATGRYGTIIPINETSFDYGIKVNSYIEIKPWVRGFGHSALVDRDVSPELFEEIKNDYRKECELYEII